MALTKGVGFNNVRSFVTDAHGAAGWAETLALFSGQDREVLDAFLSMGWYDLGLYARLIRAIDHRFGDGDLRLVQALGRYEAEKDLTTIHQWLLRLIRPSVAIEQMGKYWRRFHDTGDWTAERRGEREISARLADWGVVDAALCRELVGYLQRTLELLGARDVVMEHLRCRTRGEPECEFRALYRLRKDREDPGASSRYGIDGRLSLEVLAGRPPVSPPESDPDSRQGGMRSSVPPARGSVPPARGSVPPARGSVPPARGSVPPARGSVPPAPSGSGPEGPHTDRWSNPPPLPTPPSTRGKPRR